jgi:anti-sigma regulatory factor (Ser/Thr protein kinase)
MAATAPRFDRMVPAAPDSIGALRRELRRWARRQGAPPSVEANVALAFSEACTSVVAPDAPPDATDAGPLILEAWRDDGEISVRVSHRFRGAASRPVGETPVGYGFSLALMATLCDRFEVYRREEQPGTAVLMAFRLAPESERSSLPQPSRSSPRR